MDHRRVIKSVVMWLLLVLEVSLLMCVRVCRTVRKSNFNIVFKAIQLCIRW
jgi:hypothetical protein